MRNRSDEMLSAAQSAGSYLEDGIDRVRGCTARLQAPGGGYVNRAGTPDLYYTVFGIDACVAAGAKPDWHAVSKYLKGFGDGESLDLIHLSCLARCLARVPFDISEERACAIAGRIESFRTRDGGFDGRLGSRRGSIYGIFLACSALNELGRRPSDEHRIVGSIQALADNRGYYRNEHGIDLATTNASVGAVLLLQELGSRVDPRTVAWIQEQVSPVGGFRAGPGAPIPDLVSTATALFALRSCGVRLSPEQKEGCVQFIESLWDEEGGFYGTWVDETIDCEHTFYGLLSLGCLLNL